MERQLVQRLGREPLPEEIAEELEIDPEEVREILRMSQLPDLPREADRRRGRLVARRLRAGRAGRVPFDTGLAVAAAGTSSSRSLRSRARAARDRAPLRARRVAAVHARGGRAGVRRHPRAHPPDREQHAEEARVAPRRHRGSGLRVYASRRCISRGREADAFRDSLRDRKLRLGGLPFLRMISAWRESSMSRDGLRRPRRRSPPDRSAAAEPRRSSAARGPGLGVYTAGSMPCSSRTRTTTTSTCPRSKAREETARSCCRAGWVACCASASSSP